MMQSAIVLVVGLTLVSASYNMGYDAPSYDTPSYEAPSYDAPSYSAPSYTDDYNDLVIVSIANGRLPTKFYRISFFTLMDNQFNVVLYFDRNNTSITNTSSTTITVTNNRKRRGSTTTPEM